jgi:hypothetical protein
LKLERDKLQPTITTNKVGYNTYAVPRGIPSGCKLVKAWVECRFLNLGEPEVDEEEGRVRVVERRWSLFD